MIPPPTSPVTPGNHQGKIFSEHHDLVKNLGIGDRTEDIIRSADSCVCMFYNVMEPGYIDAAICILFAKIGKPELMWPTSDALYFHLMTVYYQTMTWKKAH